MSITDLLIKKKIAKDKKQADIIMIVVIALCAAFLLFKMFSGGNSNQEFQELTPEQIERLESGDFTAEEVDAIFDRQNNSESL